MLAAVRLPRNTSCLLASADQPHFIARSLTKSSRALLERKEFCRAPALFIASQTYRSGIFFTLNYSEKSGTLSLNDKLHSLFQRAHQTRHNEKGTNPRADVEVTGGIVSENTKVLQEIQRPNKCSVQLFKNMVLPDDG